MYLLPKWDIQVRTSLTSSLKIPWCPLCARFKVFVLSCCGMTSWVPLIIFSYGKALSHCIEFIIGCACPNSRILPDSQLYFCLFLRFLYHHFKSKIIWYGMLLHELAYWAAMLPCGVCVVSGSGCLNNTSDGLPSPLLLTILLTTRNLWTKLWTTLNNIVNLRISVS